MELYYQNAAGEKIDFTREPYVAKDINALINYGWSYGTVQGRIRKFTKEITEIPIEINIYADDQNYFEQAANRFFRIIEKDVIDGMKGRLYYQGQYMEGFFKGNDKIDWCKDVPFCIAGLTFVTDRPWWIKETHYDFYANNAYAGGSKKYAYRYPYRYGGGLTGGHIINEHFDKADFKMVIFGPVVNPLIIIGGHKYQINILLETGEYLELDTEKGTVTKVMNSGQAVNAFHNREKSSDPFAPIIPGRHSVEWTGKFGWNITLYAKRSEPEWQ